MQNRQLSFAGVFWKTSGTCHWRTFEFINEHITVTYYDVFETIVMSIWFIQWHLRQSRIYWVRQRKPRDVKYVAMSITWFISYTSYCCDVSTRVIYTLWYLDIQTECLNQLSEIEKANSLAYAKSSCVMVGLSRISSILVLHTQRKWSIEIWECKNSVLFQMMPCSFRPSYV